MLFTIQLKTEEVDNPVASVTGLAAWAKLKGDRNDDVS